MIAFILNPFSCWRRYILSSYNLQLLLPFSPITKFLIVPADFPVTAIKSLVLKINPDKTSSFLRVASFYRLHKSGEKMHTCLTPTPLYLSKRIDSAALQCFWLSYERNFLVSYTQIFRCLFFMRKLSAFCSYGVYASSFSPAWRQVQCFCLLSIFYQSFIIFLPFFLLCPKFLSLFSSCYISFLKLFFLFLCLYLFRFLFR